MSAGPGMNELGQGMFAPGPNVGMFAPGPNVDEDVSFNAVISKEKSELEMLLKRVATGASCSTDASEASSRHASPRAPSEGAGGRGDGGSREGGEMANWMTFGFAWTVTTAQPQGKGGERLEDGFCDGAYYVGRPTSADANSLRSVSPDRSQISFRGSIQDEPEFPTPPPMLDAATQQVLKRKFKGETACCPD